MSRLTWQGNSVVLALSGTLNTHALDACLRTFPLPSSAPDEIVLDMTRVRLVKPGGVGQVVSLLSWLSGRSAGRLAPTEVVGLSEAVASFLATLGVFSVLKRQAGLTNADNLLHLEEQRREHQENQRYVAASRFSAETFGIRCGCDAPGSNSEMRAWP